MELMGLMETPRSFEKRPLPRLSVAGGNAAGAATGRAVDW